MNLIPDRWWEPNALLDAARAIKDATPAEEFLCNSEYKPARQAIVAGQFARRRPWNRDWQIHLVPEKEQFPDAELKSGNQFRRFEIVEADWVDRRRCEEYRLKADKPRKVVHYDPDEEARKALVEIERVVEQKAAKRYSPNPNLLVYVNLPGGDLPDFYAHQLAQRFATSFESAWLLWQQNTVRLWPNPAKIKR
jgi:hypothetical protein